jgi:2-oxoacid:acceptor oxidoreductase delta subunit (pyruvate/2-ketoisovalerate family)
MTKSCDIVGDLKSKQTFRKESGNPKTFAVEAGLKEEEAIKAARQCLSLKACSSCEVCRLLCPELCITRNELTDRIEIDLDYCKGCGICALVCPKGAIRMVLEEGI